MNTNSKQSVFLLVILVVSLIFAGYTFKPYIENFFSEESDKNQTFSNTPVGQISKVRIPDNTEILVLLADTEPKRQKGLSGKKTLEGNLGMLFVFEKSDKHSIWMKDMNFSIDIIWINERNTIVHVERNISPDTYPQLFSSSKNALYVLEVPAGFADEHNLYIADEVTFL